MDRSVTLLGIDLSSVNLGRRGKTRAVWGRVDESGTLEFIGTERIEGDDDLLRILNDGGYLFCGIDAPLCLPPCVVCRDWRCQSCPILEVASALNFSHSYLFHFRLSDLVVKSANLGIFPKPALSNGGPVDITPLTMRWLRLARLLSSEGSALEKIFEVYTRGAVLLIAQSLGISPPTKSRNPFERQLFLQGVTQNFPVRIPPKISEQLLKSEDLFDASIACLCMWFMLREEFYLPEEFLFRISLAPELQQLARELLYQFPWPVYPNISHERF